MLKLSTASLHFSKNSWNSVQWSTPQKEQTEKYHSALRLCISVKTHETVFSKELHKRADWEISEGFRNQVLKLSTASLYFSKNRWDSVQWSTPQKEQTEKHQRFVALILLPCSPCSLRNPKNFWMYDSSKFSNAKFFYPHLGQLTLSNFRHPFLLGSESWTVWAQSLSSNSRIRESVQKMKEADLLDPWNWIMWSSLWKWWKNF